MDAMNGADQGRGGTVGVVVIGRNEGERLQRCLRTLPPGSPAVYVDSGSTDDSVAFARSLGVVTVSLDLDRPFTAARARNLGWRTLCAQHELDYVQFVDGDCEIDPDWLPAARPWLESHPRLAIVFGRRRERFPAASIFNRLCDDEWNVPVGPANACGGDALVRVTALRAVDGYTDDLIAGEEPDMCLRLRRADWQIRRIDAEMTLHDAAITSLRPWWRRSKRAGFAYAEHVQRHGAAADPQWARQVRSIAFWGAAWPLCGLIGAVVLVGSAHWAAALGLLAVLAASYLLQGLRIARRKMQAGADLRFATSYAMLTLLAKFAEFTGMVKCWTDRARRRSSRLIEYKA